MDGRLACTGERLGRHPRSKRRKLLFGLARHFCADLVAERRSDLREQLPIQVREPSDELAARLAAQPSRIAPRSMT